MIIKPADKVARVSQRQQSLHGYAGSIGRVMVYCAIALALIPFGTVHPIPKILIAIFSSLTLFVCQFCPIEKKSVRWRKGACIGRCCRWFRVRDCRCINPGIKDAPIRCGRELPSRYFYIIPVEVLRPPNVTLYCRIPGRSFPSLLRPAALV